MTRTLRTLATITLVYAVANAFYSLPQLTNYEQVFALLPQVLHTIGVTLGLALAVVALVASAQRREWRWFGPFLVLAAVNPYGGFLIDLVFTAVPALHDVSTQAGLTAFLLSYLLPPLMTACAVLAYTLPRRSTGGSRRQLSELEYSSLEAEVVGQHF